MSKPKILLGGLGCCLIIDIEYTQDLITWNKFPNEDAEIGSIIWSNIHKYIDGV